jgi:chromosome segregation ATPase
MCLDNDDDEYDDEYDDNDNDDDHNNGVILLYIVMYRRKYKLFRRWSQAVIQYRDVMRQEELSKQLKVMNKNRSSYEVELTRRLEEESSKYKSCMERVSALEKEVKDVHDRLHEITQEKQQQSMDILQRQELQYENQLKVEREKNRILTARHNTLRRQLEKEIIDLKKKNDGDEVMTKKSDRYVMLYVYYG